MQKLGVGDARSPVMSDKFPVFKCFPDEIDGDIKKCDLSKFTNAFRFSQPASAK